MSDGAWSPRRNERLRVTLHARCTSPGNDSAETPESAEDGEASEGGEPVPARVRPQDGGVTLVNITPEGCCMTTGGLNLAPMTAVLIRLETGESLTGMVRWCDGEKAGVEFYHYLTPARVEYLRREHSTFLSETDWSLKSVQRSVC
ncbi:hypothetical protein H7F51_17650 [Novosphingobium flavum]|uniref:PilZ domain-containing protein n=1 Tax=Novosphingobium flavum TaxID=1778672 RepID=A0A7X1KN73_9SPHN|nr:hypothetical protein [Novosphingobium flavum]MBC2667347.1 hypothetical protein [Novosphingobium flavum]